MFKVVNQVVNYFKSKDFKRLVKELPTASSYSIHR